MAYVGQLQTTLFLALLMMTTLLVSGCYGHESYFYITPDPAASCGEDHEPCLTLEQFASENINERVKLFVIPGQHNLTRSIEIVGADHFSILANTSVTIQCVSPASFLFENISFLKITNTAIVSCGGGGSSGAVQVKSVQQFDFSNVTLQESASVSLNVQDSKGLVTGARFIGNTGTGMNIANSRVVFEGNNTFSDNLDGGIASYDSTLQFIGVNQFTNNTAKNGGGISAISSAINCRGNMTFEYNSAEQSGGGIYARSTRMTSEGEIKFVSNTVNATVLVYEGCFYYYYCYYYEYGSGGAGLFAGDNSIVDFRGTISFVNNHVISASIYCYPYYNCPAGGGIYVATSSTVYIIGISSFIGNSARNGGGVYANNATVDIGGTKNFTNNSAQLDGGGVYARNDATVDISGTNYFIDNSAQDDGGGVYAGDATVNISGTNNFRGNSAQWWGGGVFAHYYATVDISGTNNFIDNSAHDGGGVYAYFYATVNISGINNFIDNSAQEDGGGVYARNNATVDISGTNYFIDNSAQVDGGGVCAGDATVDISGTNYFIHNSAQYGGGVYAYYYVTVCISGTNNFTGNSAQRDGGGVFVRNDATVNISGTNYFIDNSAQVDGGGVDAGEATVDISGTNNFTGNSAQREGGGVYAWNDATVIISGTNNFRGNSAHDGGGVRAYFNATVNISGTNNFRGNSAQWWGGGVFAQYYATVDISGTNNFIDNSAHDGDGGGVYAYFYAAVNISGTNNFIHNSAQEDGGGVYARNNATVDISGANYFIDNSAQEDGGGVYARNNATVDISGANYFIDNSAQVDGGGVYAYYYATVCISGTNNFTGNSAQRDGGGVFVRNDATVNISGTNYFIDNSAQVDGGGVYAGEATVDISGTNNFTGNSAQEDGGGVYAWFDATVDISGTNYFLHNSAQVDGGGVYAQYYATVCISGTNNFTGNSAQRDGGGVFVRNDATVNISGTNYFIDNSAQVDGGGVYVGEATVDISGTNNFTGNSAQDDGGGVYTEYSAATVHISGTNNFINNSAQEYGGGACAFGVTVDTSGINNFIDNTAQEGGGVYAVNRATVYIRGNNTFVNNSAQTGTGGAVSLYESAVVNISGNSSFTRNSASVRGGGVYVDTGGRAYFNGRSLFSDNWSQYGGGISLQRSGIMFEGNTVFSNNTASYGGAIQAIEANINVTENVDFTKNGATVNGGALGLDGDSVVYIFETALFTFVENRATSFGGAIYIEDNSVHCSYHWNINGFIGIYDSTGRNRYSCSKADSDLPSCFKTEIATFKDKINLAFSGNSATAGSAIFGGEIDGSITNIMFYNFAYTHLAIIFNTFTTTVGDMFQYLFSVSINDSNAQTTISSNPNRICGCVNGQPDCSDTPSPYEVTVYPGQTVGVSLVAVGQRNGTVPSATTAIYDPDNGATFGDLQSTQRIDHTTCSELNYTIFSRKQTETFKIYVDSSCGLEGIPLSVNVTLLKCPIGFYLFNSSNQCVCEERLQKYTSKCNISSLEITRTASDDFWVGVDNTNGTEGLILHPHCPFDYCNTDTVNFTLNDVSLTDNDTLTNGTMNDTEAAIGNNIDAQCKYSRSGLLCGKCQKGFSLVFGSSKCLKCSNSYLSLLIAFALAGIVLVVFLLILELTVAVGTINGLIFYANIVSVNRAQLFPSGETNVLTVFIAWVNLDLGIETCFFDGMDAYSKAWLQYAFPIYVWVLVGAIILASRHSTRIVRCLGNNPLAVLATLFLLSYAKLLRSIINPLFFTFLEYPSGTKEVWLVDGNIPYLKGKHIPLFLTSLLALFLLFIPFTLLLLLGQWIQAQSERKCFKWISDYRVSTFLDVYHGPFKKKHRYWSGLPLVTRFCLFLVFAFNVNGDTSVNILAITVCLIGLQTIIFQFNVYKAWYLNVLEASFIMNLLVLANGTYYVEISEGNQSALTYTSVSVAFATFCGIVVYHSCLQVKDTMIFKKLYKKFFAPADDTCAGDIEMKEIEEDPPRKYTKPPTTSVVEITH